MARVKHAAPRSDDTRNSLTTAIMPAENDGVDGWHWGVVLDGSKIVAEGWCPSPVQAIDALTEALQHPLARDAFFSMSRGPRLGRWRASDAVDQQA